MLTQLSVTNFKSWTQIDKMRLAPITGLFGTNSSGKTGILQLLLMLKQTTESSDRAQVLDFGTDRSLTSLGSFQEMIHGHDIDQRLGVRLAWDQDELTIKDPLKKGETLFSGRSLTFEMQVAGNGTKGSAVEQFSYGLGNNRFTMTRKGTTGSKYKLDTKTDNDFRLLRTQGRPWELPSPIKCYGFPDQTYAYYQNAGFLADLQLALEQMFQRVYYLGPLRDSPQRFYRWTGGEPSDMGRRGERAIDALLAKRQEGQYIARGRGHKRLSLEEFVALWLKELGLIHSFEVETIAEEGDLYRVRVQRSPESAKVLITDVGFGVSQILPVLVLCYYVPKGSTILLEQPEIHLHPSVQSGLADVFIDVVKNRNVQVIFESHSEHLLRRLQRRLAEESLKPEQFALYFCDVSGTGSRLTELDVDLYGSIKNWPKDFFGDEFGEMAAITEAAAKRQQNKA